MKLKKNSIRAPNIFTKNVIILNDKDFAILEKGDFSQAAKIFYLQYILDEVTIDKLKILE
jgi:hypothetical protein